MTFLLPNQSERLNPLRLCAQSLVAATRHPSSQSHISLSGASRPSPVLCPSFWGRSLVGPLGMGLICDLHGSLPSLRPDLPPINMRNDPFLMLNFVIFHYYPFIPLGFSLLRGWL